MMTIIKNIKIFYFIAVLLVGVNYPAQAFAVMSWQPAPVKHQDGGGHHRRVAKPFMLSEFEGASTHLWKPDLKSLRLVMNNGVVGIKSTGMDNYHALVAKKKTGKMTEVAIRYLYMHGKPSGISPSVLTGAVKSSFEIVPAPLPREHSRYYAAHDAVFLVRHEGQPVINSPVSITTSNGTSLHQTTDRTGAIRFTFPDDFKEIKPGRRKNKPAEFLISGDYSNNGKQYRTSLSAEYHVNPAHWRSFELGLFVIVLGFFTGLIVVRRNNKNNSKD